MKDGSDGGERREVYVEPHILATYTREELVETIRPHGPLVGYGDSNDWGCGSIGGCSTVP